MREPDKGSATGREASGRGGSYASQNNARSRDAVTAVTDPQSFRPSAYESSDEGQDPVTDTIRPQATSEYAVASIFTFASVLMLLLQTSMIACLPLRTSSGAKC